MCIVCVCVRVIVHVITMVKRLGRERHSPYKSARADASSAWPWGRRARACGRPRDRAPLATGQRSPAAAAAPPHQARAQTAPAGAAPAGARARTTPRGRARRRAWWRPAPRAGPVGAPRRVGWLVAGCKMLSAAQEKEQGLRIRPAWRAAQHAPELQPKPLRIGCARVRAHVRRAARTLLKFASHASCPAMAAHAASSPSTSSPARL